MNPILLVVLIFLACAIGIAGAIMAANIYRRREAEAQLKRSAPQARTADSQPTGQSAAPAPRTVAHIDSRPMTPAPQQYAQPRIDNSGTEVLNVLLMQQAMNNIASEERFEEYREDRAEDRHEAQEQAREYTPEPAAQEAPAVEHPEPVYTAPEPATYTPDPTPSYDAPTYDAPSYDSPSDFGGGDSGSY